MRAVLANPLRARHQHRLAREADLCWRGTTDMTTEQEAGGEKSRVAGHSDPRPLGSHRQRRPFPSFELLDRSRGDRLLRH